MNNETDAPKIWQVGDVILDLYDVRQQFSGGMGLVYRVYHRNWKTDLAVKNPKSDYFQTEADKRNFINEAETWVNLGLHPHIVSCYYVRTLGGIPRVFAEYVEDGSLADWIRSRKLYEGGQEKALERILNIAIQFAWGLQYAHEQGLIHQDVKPANVMMTADGVAKVSDFGLAKARAVTGERTSQPPGQSFLATYGGSTPAYCSLEQANAATQSKAGIPQEQQIKLTRKTDIWSWAISVWGMFCGNPPCPYGGQLAAEVFEDYLQSEKDDDLPEIPTAVVELLKRCFQANPADRPSTEDIADVLQQIYEQAIGQPYSRQIPKAVELKADSLNNRAISYLDLGRAVEAIKCWKEALREDPQHLESNFNFGYLRWQKAEITDDAYLAQLGGLETSYNFVLAYWYSLFHIHLERGDLKSRKEALDKISELEPKELNGLNDVLERANGPCGELLKTFVGHTAGVKSVYISSDGRNAWSGSQDQTLRLWDIESGRCLRTLEVQACVNSVYLSPDDRYVLWGSDDGLVQFLEIESGDLKTFKGHTDKVNCVCLSPDGQYALSGSDDKTLRLWTLATGEHRIIQVHQHSVSSVSFSPDGCYALSGAGIMDDCLVRLWHIKTGKCIQTLRGHTRWVTSVSFSPDGNYALSGSGDLISGVEDNTVRLWELKTGRCVRIFEGHTYQVTSVAFSPDEKFILSGGDSDGAVRVWELETGRCIRSFGGHTARVSSVIFSQNGRYALSGSNDTTLKLWRVRYSFYPEKLKSGHI